MKLALILLSLAALPLSASPFTYQTLAAPGATATTALGIDNSGQIVGNYTDLAGSHGFLYSNGQFSTLDPGVNVINVSLGGIILVSNPTGFATYSNGAYTTLPTPWTPVIDTPPTDVNDIGQVIASYVLQSGDQLSPVGYLGGGAVSAIVALNNQQQAVGGIMFIHHGLGEVQPFTYSGVIDDLAAQTGSILSDGSLATTFTALNDAGQVVGYTSPYLNGYPSSPTGVLYVDGTFSDIAPPDSTSSQATGINDTGVIVGWQTLNGVQQAFLATPAATSPVPEPAALALCLLGSLVLLTLRKPGLASQFQRNRRS